MTGCDKGSHPLVEEEVPELEMAEGRGFALGRKPLTVMSRNLYLGGDIGPVLGAGFDNLEKLAEAAEGVWAEVQGNDFAERAVALVDEIQAARPDVIGLQELAEFVTLEVDLSDGSVGATGAVDFEAILEEELRKRRLPYSFVAVQENTSVTIPVGGVGAHPNFIPTHLVQLTIRDAVLVRRGIRVRSVSQGNYEAMMSLGTPENPIDMKRGWIRVDARVNGIHFHFVNTHLEIQPFALIQEMQVQELLTEVVDDLGGVTVLMGDFNSNAAGSYGDPSWTSSYDVITTAGFDDAWALANSGSSAGGLTCCHASDLSNPDADFNQRIDFVFLRAAGLKGPRKIYPGKVEMEVVGDDPDLKTITNHLWPSDHAGVVANLGLKKGRFQRFR
jgi:endonuclease/exonuclease/phosphatase family metal-dependent hydrolase